jgi:hypothetical protein
MLMRNYILISMLFFGMLACNDQTPGDQRAPSTVEPSAGRHAAPAEKIIAEPLEQPEEEKLTPEMWTAFRRFRKAMLEGSCNELAQQCIFPLEGNCGMDLLKPTHDYSANQSVSKEILVQQCHFLDEIELAVLKKRTALESVTDVKNNGCIYKDFFGVGEKGDEFSWSVGCSHLLEEETGEYTRIFLFRRVDGKFRLCKIDCAE